MMFYFKMKRLQKQMEEEKSIEKNNEKTQNNACYFYAVMG